MMNTLPQRKNIRLPHYDYRQNGMYFVTLCTFNRQHTLSSIQSADNVNVQTQLTKFGTITEHCLNNLSGKYTTASISKYVIMPNHLHMIMSIEKPAQPGDALTATPALGSIIAWFKYETTKLMNASLNGNIKKHWQRSFYDHVIRSDQDYLDIWTYIDNNPAKWQEDKYYTE